MSEPESKENSKYQMIATLYKSLYEDIFNRREREFKTLDRIVLLLVVFIGFVLTPSNKITESCCLKCIFTIGITFVSGLSIIFICQNSIRYKKTVRAIVNINNKYLKVYEKGKYLEDDSYLPERFKNWGKSYWDLWIHIPLILIFTVISIILIWK